MLAKIHITAKNGVLDPQGQAVHASLQGMGFPSVDDVRIGKYIEVRLKAATREEAQKQVEDMCRRLLANTVMEQYRFVIEEN